MAIVHVSQKELCRLSGIRPNQVEPTLTALGIPLEAEEGDDLSLEITPNRPDWLSVEGVARACRDYRTGKPKAYSARPSSISWTLHPSVLPWRPVLGSAVVRRIPPSPQLLTSLIQLQEKLHDTLGRNRRKMAIGIHDLSTVRSPFTYQAVPRDGIRFVPLGKLTPMTPGQILMEHEKGMAYAHLVGERAPLITDQNGDVLSMPPVINGERTRLTERTTDMLIDCTGVSEPVVGAAVNIICACLADRGGQVEQVSINGKPYPLFVGAKWSLSKVKAAAQQLLGIPLSAPDLSRHLSRMGHAVSGATVRSPAWRTDLLHEVDLVEDVAASIGMNNLPNALPSFSSTGSLLSDCTALHESLLGLGYFEVMGWILVNQTILSRAQIPPEAGLQVSNPLTEEFTTLRPCLYPNFLD
ncbi:MAG: phenylalanine--tRNA ligase subunit beta, partial [Candidatus Micrarchaeota archaeon]|nr:phenylalanine--tRNA ligase subunit beta [Candidatus Micrarchaeota archaeon]